MRDSEKYNEVEFWADIMVDFNFDEQDFDRKLLAEAELEPAAQKRILSAVLQKAGLTAPSVAAKPETKPRTGISRRRLFALVLAAVILAFAGSMAVADVATDGKIAAFFGANDDQQQLLTAHTEFLNIVAEDQGGSVTVRQVLGDEHNIFVVFDVKAPAGTVLDSDWYLFESSFVDFGGSNSMGYYFEVLTDEDPTDNQISMMLLLSSHKDLRGETMYLMLENLYTVVEDSSQVVMPGHFELEIPLDYEDMAVSYELKQPLIIDLPQEGAQAQITELELSPLTATLQGDIGWQGLATEDDLAPVELSSEDLKLILKDGTTVDCISSGNSSRFGGVQLTYQFEQMVDLQEIAQIEFKGQELVYK